MLIVKSSILYGLLRDTCEVLLGVVIVVSLVTRDITVNCVFLRLFTRRGGKHFLNVFDGLQSGRWSG